jgi:trimeric autotransporter adhesin
MADRKISDLTALTTPASGDFLPIVDISEAAAASKNKRITIEELFRGVPLGTAAAPSIAIEGNENTGVFSPGANELAVATNGTRRLLIDSAGALTLDTGDATIYGVRVGRGAGADISNTVVGNGALQANTTGIDNTANGYRALYSNTIGNSNTAAGLQALNANISGNSNTAAGLQALYYNTIGNNNTAAGYRTLFNNTGSDNTANGHQALNNNTTGSNNIGIGKDAGTNLTTGSNNTIIGSIAGTAGLANTVIIGAGATERLRITSAGLVGVGTSSPSYKLDVSVATNDPATGSPAAGSFVQVAGGTTTVGNGPSVSLSNASGAKETFWRMSAVTTSGNNGDLVFNGYNGGANYPERLRITAAGNVGIGTTSPAYAFVVSAAGASGIEFGPAYSGTANLIQHYSRSGSVYVDAVNDATQHRFQISGTERARIDSSGRLLVGTSTTDSNFNSGVQIAGIGGSNAGSQLISRFSADAASSTLWFQKSRGASVGTNTIVNNGDDLGLIGFYGASGSTVNEAARITAQVDGTPGASNDMPGRLVFSTTADGAATPTERMRIASNGKTTIKGSTSDSSAYSLEVTESGGIVQFTIRNDGIILTGTDTLSPYNNTTASAANLFVTSGGELQRSTSSLKYKKNVQNAPYGLQELMALRAVTYQGKSASDGNTVYGGLIAEEVDAAGLQEFVQYADDGTPDALAYGNMVSLCIKAIQEQQAMIAELQAKVAVFESA